MKKEKIHHIKSQPHHPMTLGKIERFWATIYEEFLVRAQFTSFDEARERIQKWVKYYNHKRPHQGIGSLCPADRYFEIAAEMKKTLEAGIEENILEMALRGKPQAPFYMVGRLDGQSVILRAEKGKLRLRVEDEETQEEKEITYTIKEKEHGEEEAGKEVAQGYPDGAVQSRGRAEAEGRREVRERAGKVPGRSFGVDGATESRRGVPGAEGALCPFQPLAGQGLGGDAAGVDASCEPRAGGGPAAEAPAHPGEAEGAPHLSQKPDGEALATAFEPFTGLAGEGENPASRRRSDK